MSEHNAVTASAGRQDSGFTGVDWSSRSAERLRADLFAGPGPVPAGELGAAWAGVALELDACAAELRALLVLLDSDVVMAASPLLSEHGRALAEWLENSAREARGLSERAFSHAGSVTRARASMPSAAEFDATRQALEALAQLGPGAAGILGGAHHAVEQAQQDAERTAAGVMVLYEQQNAPLVASTTELIAAPRLTLPAPSETASVGALEPGVTEVEDASVMPAPARAVQVPATPVAATRPVRSQPAFAHIAEKTSHQVRPAALVAATGGTGAEAFPGAKVGALSGMASGGAPAGTAQPANPVAPIGPVAPVHRGPGAPAETGPVAEVHDAPARASELFGLSVAVAPPVIGESQAGVTA